MVITSVNNNKIKEISKLNDKKYRDSTNTFLIEGYHLVEEAIRSNLLKELILLEGEDMSFDGPITYVNDKVMKKLSGMNSYPKVMGICHKKKEENIGNRVLILEDIQDPGNIGTIIRSSVAFNVDTIILSNKCADIYSSKVIRSTQGMLFHSNIITCNIIDKIKYLKDNSYTIYGTKVDGGSNIKDINLPSKYVLVIGNEGNGMSDIVSNLCDEYLYIKMNNRVESLNAGVATSILLYEMDNK